MKGILVAVSVLSTITLAVAATARHEGSDALLHGGMIGVFGAGIVLGLGLVLAGARRPRHALPLPLAAIYASKPPTISVKPSLRCLARMADGRHYWVNESGEAIVSRV